MVSDKGEVPMRESKLDVNNGWSICPGCGDKFANTDGSLPDCGCTDPDLRDHDRPMGCLTRDEQERLHDAQDAKEEICDPGGASSATQGSMTHLPYQPLRGLHFAKACDYKDHRKDLAAAGIERSTTYCLICAVRHACTVELLGSSRILREEYDEILAWALEVAAISHQDCENLAQCAAEAPRVFLLRHRYAQLRKTSNLIERSRQELRGTFSALIALRTRYQTQIFQTDLGLELGGITSQVASALALLEEIGR
jgi:hypothetical protein